MLHKSSWPLELGTRTFENAFMEKKEPLTSLRVCSFINGAWYPNTDINTCKLECKYSANPKRMLLPVTPSRGRNAAVVRLTDSVTDGHSMNKHQTLKTISSRFARTVSLNCADAALQVGLLIISVWRRWGGATDHDKCRLEVQNTPPPERSCAARGAQKTGGRGMENRWGPRGPFPH